MGQSSFGTTNDGQAVEIYTLSKESSTCAGLITYGGILTELWVPDRDGVLGFDSLAQYETETPYFGCITGRVANRIAEWQFTLDGTTYSVAVNNGPNHLHEGIKDFDKVVWDADVVERSDGEALRLRYTSPDGEEGYPGTLSVSVTYILTRENALRIEYEATTDQATPINLTNHSYFNLAGKGNVLDHILTLHAKYYTEPDETLIPTGRLLPVAGAPLDFTLPASVGGRIGQVDISGYDHNYVLDNGGCTVPGLAAELYELHSGRVLKLCTIEPGVQVYSEIHLDVLQGKRGAVYDRYHGLCIETQHYPYAISQPGFPSIVQRPC